MDLSAPTSDISRGNIANSVELNSSFPSILKSNGSLCELDDDDDDQISLISEIYDDQEDDVYSRLPLNKNNKYTLNLLSDNNTQATLLLKNYKSNVLNDMNASSHDYLNITNSELNNSCPANATSRPGSSKLKEKSKKIHIENIIDSASMSNLYLEKEGFSSLPIKLNNSFLMSNVTSELSTITTTSEVSTKESVLDSIKKPRCLDYPLCDNFNRPSCLKDGIEFFIQNSIKKTLLAAKQTEAKETRNRQIKSPFMEKEYLSMFEMNQNELIDLLIEKVESKGNPNGFNKPQDLLPAIYYLKEPALSFSQFMKERVCVSLGKGTLIYTINQLDTDLKDIVISESKKHKFIFALLKHNYKLNNDVLTISMRTFVKMSGLEKRVLNVCELEMISFLFSITR